MVKVYLDHEANINYFYFKFEPAVMELATGTGSLNERLFRAWKYYLMHLYSAYFKDNSIRDRFDFLFENLGFDYDKIWKDFYSWDKEKQDKMKKAHQEVNFARHNYINIHWKKSKKCAEVIWSIYQDILEIRNKKMEAKYGK